MKLFPGPHLIFQPLSKREILIIRAYFREEFIRVLSNILTDYFASLNVVETCVNGRGGNAEISEHVISEPPGRDPNFVPRLTRDSFACTDISSISAGTRAYRCPDPRSGGSSLHVYARRWCTRVKALPQEAGFVTSRQVFSMLRHAAAICLACARTGCPPRNRVHARERTFFSPGRGI